LPGVPPELDRPTAASVTHTFRRRYGASIIASVCAVLMYFAATGGEILVERLLRPSQIELTRTSDALLAVAFAVAVFFWLHLKWTRQALSDLERAHIVLDTQLTVAADIQRQLLPPIPATPDGFRWGARLEQAGKIGGDLYDVVERTPGCWLVLVGDVSGKGIPAALVLASIRTMFRMLVRETDDPGAIVERISRTLYEENGGMPYLTCVVARVDVQRREISYVSAGHPPGIVVDGRHADRGRSVLDSTGPPAGLFAAQTYQTTSFSLEPGAVSIFVTDGITESFDRLGAPEPEPVVSVVEHLPRPLAPDRICDSLIERTTAAISTDGAGWQDDRTVVAFTLKE
jgi:serine phosphatase RsbU (regulator of sigma subunit)